MENTKLSGISFKEMLNDSTTLNMILNHTDREDLRVEKIISNYEKNINRFGVIFMIKDTKTKKLEKIIIDAIYGEPDLTQIEEITYGQGFDCDRRFIFYTLEHPDCAKIGFRNEREMIKGFTKVNNDCGFETIVAQVALASDGAYRFKIEVSPDGIKWSSFNKLPSKEEFEKAVFKTYYNSSDTWGGYEDDYLGDLNEWFTGTYWYLDMNGISFMYPVWDENGLFVQAVSETHEGADYLNSIKENNQKYLSRMFIGRKTTFETAVSGRVTMLIKLWDKPISFFTNASPADKEKIVEYLRNSAHRIDEYWNYRHCIDGSRNDDVVEYLVIPEDAFSELEKEISVK